MYDDNEYLDMEYFLYTTLIVKYKNNCPQIVSCCENILNGAYIIDTYAHSKHRGIKIKMICVNNEDINKYPIDDTDIYNSDSVFVKNIIQSEYIDLQELWEPNRGLKYILYKIINHCIVPIMISDHKDKITATFLSLHDTYLIGIDTNTYYDSIYNMKSFEYNL